MEWILTSGYLELATEQREGKNYISFSYKMKEKNPHEFTVLKGMEL